MSNSKFIAFDITKLLYSTIPMLQKKHSDIEIKLANLIKVEIDKIQNLKKEGKTDAEILFILYNKIDNNLLPDDMTHISCKKGCAFCCYAPVHISEVEFQVILEHCLTHDIEPNLSNLEKPGKYQPCVYLTKENTCSIYEVRPSGCRKYFVTTDPKWCDITGEEEHDIVNYVTVGIEIAVSAFINVYKTVGFLSDRVKQHYQNDKRTKEKHRRSGR